MFEKFHLTKTGLGYLAKAQAGQQLRFTKVEIGNGIQPAGYDPTIQDGLVNPLRDIPISRVTASGQKATISCAFSNEKPTGGMLPSFYWTEAGLYAEVVGDLNAPPALYAYTNTMTQAKGDYIGQDSLVEFRFNWLVSIGNASDVTAMIDESLVFITKSEYWDYLKSANNYDFKEEVIGKDSKGNDLYCFTTTIFKSGSTQNILAIRIFEEAEIGTTGFFEFTTTTTIGASVYKEIYTELADGGQKREVI